MAQRNIRADPVWTTCRAREQISAAMTSVSADSFVMYIVYNSTQICDDRRRRRCCLRCLPSIAVQCLIKRANKRMELLLIFLTGLLFNSFISLYFSLALFPKICAHLLDICTHLILVLPKNTHSVFPAIRKSSALTS